MRKMNENKRIGESINSIKLNGDERKNDFISISFVNNIPISRYIWDYNSLVQMVNQWTLMGQNNIIFHVIQKNFVIDSYSYNNGYGYRVRLMDRKQFHGIINNFTELIKEFVDSTMIKSKDDNKYYREFKLLCFCVLKLVQIRAKD